MAAKPQTSSSSKNPYAIKSSSKLSLLAEINKRKNDSNADATPQASTSSYQQAPKRAGTKSKWQTNKGILDRMAADEAALATSSSSGSAHVRQSVLIQKAKLYEKLRKGDMSGLTAGQRATLNVDFEAKNMQDWDKDESLTVPLNSAYESGSEEYSESEEEGLQPASKGEDLVEIIDDFGRARMVPRSQAPKLAKAPTPPPPESNFEVDPDNVYYGEQMQFPVYEPTAEELQARQKALGIDEPLFQHYDASQEVRTKGASHFQFSKDEAERKAQMDAIRHGRAEAEREIVAEDRKKTLADKEKQDRKQLLADKKRKLLEARAKMEEQPAKVRKLEQ